MEKDKKTKTKRRGVLVFFAILFALVFIGAGSLSLYKFWSYKLCENTYGDIRTNAVITRTEEEKEEWYYNNPLPFNIDFNELWKINTDVVAWIYIPCIDCSYPVMYSGDNSFYLHRDIYKDYLFSGSLFIDRYNHKDFTSPNTIIYGHNMLDGGMFGILWYIPFQGVAENDPYFWIITPDEVVKYRIFTAFETNIETEAFKRFTDGDDGFEDWCFRMRNYSFINTGSFVFKDSSRVVTLATCGASSWDRTIVSGIKEETFDLNPTYKFTEVTTHKDMDVSEEEKEISDIEWYLEMFHDRHFYFCLLATTGLIVILFVIIILATKPKTPRADAE